LKKKREGFGGEGDFEYWGKNQRGFKAYILSDLTYLIKLFEGFITSIQS